MKLQFRNWLNRSKSSGNDDSNSSSARSVFSQKKDRMSPESSLSKAPVQMGVAADTLLRLHRDLFEFGRQRALTSGDVRADPEVLKGLEAHAEAMAREQAAAKFDIKNSVHDQLRKAKYEAARASLPQIEEQVAMAEDEIRKRRDALAEQGPVPERPGIPWYLFIFSSVFVGLTVAPTLHDFFFDLDNVRQAWFFSVLGGTFSGFLIMWSLLCTFESTTTDRAFHLMGFLGGILFGLGLLAIRLVGADSQSAYFMAAGLASLEIAAVILADWVGRGLRRRFAEYENKRAESERLAQLLSAAEHELAYHKDEAAKRQNIIQEFIDHVYDREARSKQIESLVRGARQAVRDGYAAGRMDNEARIRSHRRKGD